jgi:predicted kinase
MSGLPGAGKDTWVENHADGRAVISLDALRYELDVDPADDQGAVVKRAQEMARDYLRREQPFIWNATNISRQLREGLIDLIAGYKGRVHIVYVETTWQELMHRNQTRARSIPPAVIQKLANKLEVPDLTEAHQVDWIMAG